MIRIEARPRPRVRVIGSLDGRAVRVLFDVISHTSDPTWTTVSLLHVALNSSI